MVKNYQLPEFQVIAQNATNVVFYAASSVGEHSFQSTAAKLAYQKEGTGKLVVSGGWFSTAVDASDCASGYVPADADPSAPNPSAKYSVKEAPAQ